MGPFPILLFITGGKIVIFITKLLVHKEEAVVLRTEPTGAFPRRLSLRHVEKEKIGPTDKTT